MTYRLIDVGHDKFNGVVTVKNDIELRKEVKKHLASKLIDIDWYGTRATITVGGFRVVGAIEEVGENI